MTDKFIMVSNPMTKTESKGPTTINGDKSEEKKNDRNGADNDNDKDNLDAPEEKRPRVTPPDLNVVVSGGQLFREHSLILALASPYLCDLIEGLKQEENSLSFPDMEPDVWAVLIKFMRPFANHGGEIINAQFVMTAETVPKVVFWLHKFRMTSLLEMVQEEYGSGSFQSCSDFVKALAVYLSCDMGSAAKEAWRNYSQNGSQYKLIRRTNMFTTPADVEAIKQLFLRDDTKDNMWKLAASFGLISQAMVDSPDREELVQKESFLDMI